MKKILAILGSVYNWNARYKTSTIGQNGRKFSLNMFNILLKFASILSRYSRFSLAHFNCKQTLVFLFSANIGFAADTSSDKLKVVLDWFPNPDHAPLIIAQQQGFFKEQGLDVELIGPADPTDPPKWIAAGKADIGITYEPQFMEQVDQGLPLIRMGALIDKPLDCLVALKDSKINSLADLKNKRIGSSTDGLNSIMLKTMLAKQGLENTDVELINIRYNLTQALLSHQVEAVSGLMRNFEVPQIKSLGYNVSTFFPEDYGIPTYNELIFIINTANIQDKRFPRFLAALKKAIVYLHAHPNETWEGYTKQYPESNNSVNHAAWFATMPYFAKNPTYFNSKEWEQFARFMYNNHMIKKVQAAHRYAVALQ